MTQIPLLSGTIATEQAEYATSYPVNLEPSYQDSGISKMQLRSAQGANTMGAGPGVDRGAIEWNGVLYRVMGTSLVSIAQDGSVKTLGDVGSGGPVAMDFGFNQLAINSGPNLYFWDGATLKQMADTSFGSAIDMLWFSGYYVFTDGTNVVTTNLSDPTTINPLAYGAPDDDPGALQGLYKLRGELYVLCDNIIAIFSNVGGANFPFQEEPTATIPYGCVGPRAKCRLLDSFAFVGNARGEAPAVYKAGSGTASKISTRAIEELLAAVDDLSTITMESRVYGNEQRVYVHLPDKSLVYLAVASTIAQDGIWYIAASGLGMNEAYRPRNAVLAYGQFWVGDVASSSFGVLTDQSANDVEQVAFLSLTRNGETYTLERPNRISKPGQRLLRMQWNPHLRARNYLGVRFRGDTGLPHFSESVGWRFDTPLIYNAAKSFIVHALELIGLPGRGSVGFAALEADIESLSA